MSNKTTNDLRGILFQEIQSLRAGQSTPNQATAVSKLATNIINSAALEISVARVLQSAKQKENPSIGLEPMKLVSDS